MKINKTSIALSILISLLLVCLVSAQAPQLFNYQGRLTNKDGTPASGTKFIVFSIYPDTLPTSKALWFEDRNITVMNGMFNIYWEVSDLFTIRYLPVAVIATWG